MKKRILSFILCLIMIVGMLPVVAGAEESTLGDFVVSSNDISSASYVDGTLRLGTGSYTVSMAEGITESDDTIVASDGVTLVLDGVKIASAGAAVTVNGQATLMLKDGTVNQLKSTSSAALAIGSNDGTYSITVTCEGESGAGHICTAGTCGSLKAIGGTDSAAIGGASAENANNITIAGGIIEAVGGTSSAAIGGGKGATGSNITISGGIVTAEAGLDAPMAIGNSTETPATVKLAPEAAFAIKDSASATDVAAYVKSEGTLSETLTAKPYLSIQNVATYTVTVTGGTAISEKFCSGETVSISAGNTPSGYVDAFGGWTSADGVTFADAKAKDTSFVMPAKNVTVVANWTEKGKTAVESKDWTVPMATANTASALKTWIESEVAKLINDGTTAVVNVTATTPATAGSMYDADGTDGKYTFNVVLTTGNDATVLTFTDKVIKATAYTGTLFAPVTNITGVPTSAYTGIALPLTGTVAPNNATYTNITWSVKNAGYTRAYIISGSLYTYYPGTVVVTATVAHGKGINSNYTQDFTITVTAPPTYTVTFNENGGTIYSGKMTAYTYGTGATLPTNITKANYTFGGWYDNASLSGTAVTEISKTDTGNKTYWAKWVDKASVSVTETMQKFTYDGTRKDFAIKGTDLTGFIVSYKQNNIAVNPINAGVYDVVITRVEDKTYKAFSKTIIGGLVIEKIMQSINTDTSGRTASCGQVLSARSAVAAGLITFESSNPSIATVDARTGVITARKAGEVYIIIKAAEHVNYFASSKSYKLTVSHNFGTTLKSDSSAHWSECSCGARSLLSAHTPGAAATCKEPQKCTKCSFVIKNVTDHIFGNKYASDVNNHWYECTVCKTAGNKVAHSYSDWTENTANKTKSRTCSICSYVHTMSTETTAPETTVPVVTTPPETTAPPVETEPTTADTSVPTPTEPVESTGIVTTDPTTTTPSTENEGGCGSSIGAGAMLFVASLGACAVFVTKKREEE